MGHMMPARGWGNVVYSDEKSVMASKVLPIPPLSLTPFCLFFTWPLEGA